MRRPLWRCPKCGARLASRNLSHSCGRFTLKDLCARSNPEVLALAKKTVALFRELGQVQVLPQKTRLVVVARVRFAGFVPRKDHLLSNFALRRVLNNPRVEKRDDYGPRWHTHHVRIRSERDLDAELRSWLRESYASVGQQAE